jgi:hypothetical protein
MTWLSYWKNLEGLGGFATSAAHRLGAVNYEKKKYPNMGIMHETYHAPKGHWETIYDNMPPWGLGKSKGFYYVNIMLQKSLTCWMRSWSCSEE